MDHANNGHIRQAIQDHSAESVGGVPRRCRCGVTITRLPGTGMWLDKENFFLCGDARPHAPDCPPSAVVDQIIPWGEVQDGELLIWEGEWRLVERNLTYLNDPNQHLVIFADNSTAEIPCGTYTAVRRYTEG